MSGLSPAAPIRGVIPYNKTHVVSAHRRVLINLVSAKTLQPSIEPAITNFSVPLNFFVEVQVSGLETVHPIQS